MYRNIMHLSLYICRTTYYYIIMAFSCFFMHFLYAYIILSIYVPRIIDVVTLQSILYKKLTSSGTIYCFLTRLITVEQNHPPFRSTYYNNK